MVASTLAHDTRDQADLELAINGLRISHPEFAARPTFTAWQLRVFVALLIALIVLIAIWPVPVGIALVAATTFWYIATVSDRAMLVLRGLRRPGLIRISDEVARAIPDADLPVFTILLPAFHEPEIMRELLAGVGRLEYPADKLDIKLLLEADDQLTVDAAREGHAETIAEMVLVPASEPRTKPKACNYGLLRARGEYVTIYDAEDIPEPLQLRRVVAAFRTQPEDVACLQARLGYFNERQNLLTRWFACEYDQWFAFVLPAMAKYRVPIPLGGTSNHIRRDVLLAVGGWDAFNVTEDADLGIRLARMGYRTAVIDSITLEEANSDGVNWIRQRSRWLKGYLQTFLVHTRHPRQTWRELGPRGFIRFAAMMLGNPISNIINVFFFVIGLMWLIDRPDFVIALLPRPLYFATEISFVAGNAITIYLGLLSTKEEDKPYLVTAVLLTPLYWFLMSFGAVKAVIQLILQPSYWEKTVHGLTTPHGSGDG